VLLRAALARCAGERERRGLTCLGVGALVSLVPVAGSLPGDRLLIATSLGVCAVIACLVARVGRSLARHVLLSAVLLGALGVHAGQRTHQQVAIFRAESEALRIWALDADLPRGEEAADDRVYVIASADFTTAANLPWLRRAHGLPTARSYRRLCPSASALELTRVDDRALDLTLLTLDRNDGAVPSLYRSLANPLRAGDTFSVPGLTVRVLLMRGETPSRMRFTFDRSLDDAHLVFLQSTPRGLRRVTLPALGQRVRMARPVMRDLRYAGLGPRDPATE
jgi:hypothetical protein